MEEAEEGGTSLGVSLSSSSRTVDCRPDVDRNAPLAPVGIFDEERFMDVLARSGFIGVESPVLFSLVDAFIPRSPRNHSSHRDQSFVVQDSLTNSYFFTRIEKHFLEVKKTLLVLHPKNTYRDKSFFNVFKSFFYN